jgi:RNA polymerase sigma-70 factor (ECF subfamily)
VPPDDDDLALMRAAQEGDVDAFAAIVRRHEQRLRLVVRRILEDRRDVEEAVQDIFVQAWRNLDRYRGEAAVFTWLYRIGVNEGLARRRRRRLDTLDLDTARTAEASDLRPDSQPSPVAEATEVRQRVLAALGSLPLDYREAVVLRDLAGLSNEEVAAALGLTIPAAKSRIHRGRLQLRELLDPDLAA